jgi:hypothetical protein
MPGNPDTLSEPRDKRTRYRPMELTDPMAVIWSSTGPTYQLKARDLPEQGAGIIVKSDSNFLKMIEVGQEINAELILPRDYSFT